MGRIKYWRKSLNYRRVYIMLSISIAGVLGLSVSTYEWMFIIGIVFSWKI